MKRTIIVLILGLIWGFAPSCLKESDNCSIEAILHSTEDCDFGELCELQASKKGLAVTISGAECSSSEGKKAPGANCSKDGQCRNGICVEGTCTKLCLEKGQKCAGGEQCVVAGWLKVQGGTYKVGYCAKKAACVGGEDECGEGTECRYLIGNNGIPGNDGTYPTGCTPLLGDKEEGDSCDFSDQCGPGMVCAEIPNMDDSDQICRAVCAFSAGCADSTLGEWCSMDLGGSQDFQFEANGEVVGVCTEDPSAPADDSSEDDENSDN
jgi:hypothetical protein